MAIDERQTTGLREGAGREESRYNLEFIDFLQRWGTPLLLIAALVSGAFLAFKMYKEKKIEQLDNAFVEYEAASGDNASPEALIAVAEQFGSVKSVSLLARLDAADAYLQSVRSGAKPGARFKTDGTLESADDAMTPADRESFLAKAEEQFKAVLSASEGDSNRKMFATGALFGLAAIAESREKYDEAKANYDRVIALAPAGTVDLQAEIAKQRIASIDSLKTLPPLLSRAELPKPPEPPAPAPAPGTEPTAITPIGPVLEPIPGPPVTNPAADPAAPAPTPTPVADPAPTTPPATPGTTPPTTPPATDPAPVVPPTTPPTTPPATPPATPK